MTRSRSQVISFFVLLVQSINGLALEPRFSPGLRATPIAAACAADPDSVVSRPENSDFSLWKNYVSRRAICASTAVAVFPLIASSSPASANSEIATPMPFQVSMQVALDEAQTGEIIIQVEPEWAPLAAERFEQLLEDDYFTNAKFFRVLPGYVGQFGIAANPELNKKWMFDKSTVLKDEPRLQPNKKGTLSFASSGKNSRQTQIFINLSNNDGPPNFLDAQGFVPFARVVKGMEDVVPKLYSGYGVMESATAGMAGSVNQGKAAYYGNEYLEAIFPKLSTIKKVTRVIQE
jgi:peptidyl-prolyl cis-trans isomerase A (cyclophilin A)